MTCGGRRFALFGVLDDSALAAIHHHIADLSLQPGQRLYDANTRGTAACTLPDVVLRLERSSERGYRRPEELRDLMKRWQSALGLIAET